MDLPKPQIQKHTSVFFFIYKVTLRTEVWDDQNFASFHCWYEVWFIFFFLTIVQNQPRIWRALQYSLLRSDLVMYKNVSSLSQTYVECLRNMHKKMCMIWTALWFRFLSNHADNNLFCWNSLCCSEPHGKNLLELLTDEYFCHFICILL